MAEARMKLSIGVTVYDDLCFNEELHNYQPLPPTEADYLTLFCTKCGETVSVRIVRPKEKTDAI